MEDKREDGEYFADEQQDSIPPADTWELLSMSQLIDVKNKLEERAWQFRSQPGIANVLKKSVLSLSALITERSKS